MSWGGRRIAVLRRRVVEVYGTACHLCGTETADPAEVGHLHPLALSLDHLVPRSRGGTDAIDNLRPAHRRCNLSRGARPTSTARPPTPPRPVVDGSAFFG